MIVHYQCADGHTSIVSHGPSAPLFEGCHMMIPGTRGGIRPCGAAMEVTSTEHDDDLDDGGTGCSRGRR